MIDHIVYDGLEEPWPCELHHTTRVNARPPALWRVCHESRKVAAKTGIFLQSSNDRPQNSQWRSLAIKSPWLDRTRDSLHVSWTPSCEGDYEYSRIGHPLRNLAAEAAGLSQGVSIMLEYLETSDQAVYGVPVGNYDIALFHIPDASVQPPIGPYDVELRTAQLINLEALLQLSRCHVVMEIHVIHSKLQRAASTGLFGLSGDAPIQIVGMREEARLEELWSFADQCERESGRVARPDLQRANATSMKQKLNDIIADQFNMSTLTRLQPAIMFRLCTQNCNLLLSS